jgi:hypothetical protein
MPSRGLPEAADVEREMTGTLLDGAAQAWRLAVNYLKDKERSRRAMREVDSLGSSEAARVLSEVGLSRGEFAAAMSHPFASDDLLSQALSSVGIDPDEFGVRNIEWLQGLQRSCMRCGVRGRCKRIMARDEFTRRHQDFCPNSGDFEQILARQASGPVPHETAWRNPEAPFQPRAATAV